MAETIDLGLDFGSIFFRAAYMLDHEVVPVPISRSERAWSGAVFTADPQAHKPFLFESLKSRLGAGGQLILFGPDRATITERVRELLALFKAHVEDYAGCAIRRVVIVVPGYYPDVQRAAVRQIAEVVGFQQVELISDCRAAALGYTTLVTLEQPLHLLVFSMGFMGFEVSLIVVDQEGCHKIADWGGLGPSGRDIDRLLMETCVAEAEGRNMPLPFIDDLDQSAWRDFRDVVEEAKKRLGLGEDVQITLPANFTAKFPLPMLLRVADFEAAVQGYVEQAMETVTQVLAAGQTRPPQVDKVLLVGGTTRLPSFQAGLEALFGPNLIQPRENLLARGAAVYAAGEDTVPEIWETPAPLVELSQTGTQTKSRHRQASEIQNPPTPEAILSYAQTLADARDYDAATEYLTRILESIQTAWAHMVSQRG
jgi:molecular chaperone DnaK (HSP70)